MDPSPHVLAVAHPLLGLLWAVGCGAALAGLAWGPRAARVAAAAMAPLALLQSAAQGWWPGGISTHVLAGVTVAGVAWAGSAFVVAPAGRAIELPARLALAGFFLALGFVALETGVPLPPPLAGKSMAYGLAVAVMPPAAAGGWLGRTAHGLVLLLLLAAAALGLHPA